MPRLWGHAASSTPPEEAAEAGGGGGFGGSAFDFVEADDASAALPLPLPTSNNRKRARSDSDAAPGPHLPAAAPPFAEASPSESCKVRTRLPFCAPADPGEGGDKEDAGADAGEKFAGLERGRMVQHAVTPLTTPAPQHSAHAHAHTQAQQPQQPGQPQACHAPLLALSRGFASGAAGRVSTVGGASQPGLPRPVPPPMPRVLEHERSQSNAAALLSALTARLASQTAVVAATALSRSAPLPAGAERTPDGCVLVFGVRLGPMVAGCLPFREVLRGRLLLLRAPLVAIQRLLEAAESGIADTGASADREVYTRLLRVYQDTRTQIERLCGRPRAHPSAQPSRYQER